MQQVQRWLLWVVIGLIMAACNVSQGVIPMDEHTLNQSSITAVVADTATVTDTTPGLPLPRLMIEIPLAADNAALVDFRLDRDQQRLYVTDTAGQLYILDAVTYDLLATLPAMGELTLDTVHHRLYVAPGAWYFLEEGQSIITVIDTTTNTMIGIVPGHQITVDPVRNRLFVGDPINLSTEPEVPGIRIYDGATLAQTGELPQAGVPVYNPLRDELLVMAHTVYVVDLVTQQVTTDLFPELAAQEMPWCNGCTWADAVHVFPTANLAAIYVRSHCMGGGCDFTGPPTFFDATTLQPLTDLARLPELQGACGSAKMRLPAIGGHTYRTYAFHRYVSFHNLMVYDEAGALVTWRDGLLVHFINPQTAQAYLAGGDVLDLATLTPVGHWPDGCIFTYDEARGLIYAAGLAETGSQGVLRVIAQEGGAPSPPGVPQRSSPAGHAITAILSSPAYANDKTLLALADQGLLFRSTDSGKSWQQLHGGLPEGEPLSLQVAFSPSYAEDRTIFAAGYRDEGRGEGGWRSTDGGNTWAPLWQGLTHLRISELLLSPFYTIDKTLFVKASYHQVATGEVGQSWQRSTDGGLSWSVVATGTSDLDLSLTVDLLLAFLGVPQAELLVRISEEEHRLQYSPNEGRSWLPIPLPLADGEWVQTLAPSPTYAEDGIIYALSDYHLWRTMDNGHTWQRWQDVLDQPRDYATGLRVLALSPQLHDGRYHLFLGATDGQVLVLDSVEQVWQAVVQ